MIYVLIALIVYLLYEINRYQRENKKLRESLSSQECEWMKYADELRAMKSKSDEILFATFNVERQQLLDRIQSPTFAEYKHQEVKVIKAKNGTDKPDVVIEQL